MIKKRIVSSQSGFSLIELMVVVGIIGLLAAIAVPQFSKFQARARQSEVKSNLAALFSAEKAFFSEWTHYTVNVLNAGFGVEGARLRYDMGFSGMANCGATYAALLAPPPEGAAPLGRLASANLGAGSQFAYGAPPTALAGLICTQATFTARAFGDPDNTPLAPFNDDVWTIDQLKTVAQTANGID